MDPTTFAQLQANAENSYRPSQPKAQPKKKKRGGLAGLVGNVVHGAVAPFEYLGKAAIVNPVRQLAAEATGNKKAAKNAKRATRENLGLGEKGTDFGGGLKKFVGNSAGALLSVAAPGANTIKRAATIGAGGGASAALAEKDSNLEDVISGALVGGATGGALKGCLLYTSDAADD